MKRIKNLLNIYSIIIVLSILILIFVLKLWKADLSVPLMVNTGDTLFNLMSIKGLSGSGWYFHNEFLGAPFGLDLYDLPMADSFHLILLKILVILFKDSVIALNLYFISIFPLTAVTTYFVFRCLKISSSVSIVVSLLYAFLPYAFLRGENHIFLAAYYTIPLITLIILSLWSNNLPLLSNKQNSKSKLGWRTITSRKSLFCIVVCIILGSTGVYYAFFACLLIAVASISAFLYKRDKNVFLSALVLIALISTSFFLNILPSLVYTYQQGVNPDVAWRNFIETETFGLKITNLLLPIQNYRFGILRDSIKEYQEIFFKNENIFAALGIIGSIGFLSLLCRSVFIRNQSGTKISSPSFYDRLAVLNISAFLFGTVGGFGTIFALLVTPQIRGTNRISIFIAFFSLLAVALFIDSFNKKYVKTTRHKIVFTLLLTSGLLIGILDQTSPAFVPNYSVLKNEYIDDKSFVQTLERILPIDSMVFQLPYVPFPENGGTRINLMHDYDLLRGYLHSKNLKWSYGAMQGRNFNWHQLISEEPLDIFLSKISIVGFNGIYIDRSGYSDNGQEIEMKLLDKLGVEPVVSKSNRLVFFNMEPFNKELRSHYSPEQIEIYKSAVLNPIVTEWKDGFSYLEKLSEEKWRWSDQQGTLVINNPQSKPKQIEMSMSLQSGWPNYSNLKIESNLFSEVIKINDKASVFEKTLLLTPGKHPIKFLSEAEKVYAPLDKRNLFFKILNFRIEEMFENLKLEKLSPTQLEWKEGFYNTEWIFGGKWRWCDKQGTLIINNPTSEARETRLSMALVTSWHDYSNLRIESELFSEVVKINNKESIFEKRILLPPGKHTIKFSSDAKPTNKAPGDTRKLFFRINEVLF